MPVIAIVFLSLLSPTDSCDEQAHNSHYGEDYHVVHPWKDPNHRFLDEVSSDDHVR